MRCVRNYLRSGQVFQAMQSCNVPVLEKILEESLCLTRQNSAAAGYGRIDVIPALAFRVWTERLDLVTTGDAVCLWRRQKSGADTSFVAANPISANI